MRIYHTIYETTNLVNGKKYRGAHSTTNPYDDYMGSGVALSNAIKKHGRSNFTKEILFNATTEQDMYLVEQHFVDENWVNDRTTYNQTIGGRGRKVDKGTTPTIHQYTFERKLINSFESVRQASLWIVKNLHIDFERARNLLYKVCSPNNRNDSAFGYLWSITNNPKSLPDKNIVHQWSLDGNHIKSFNTASAAVTSVGGYVGPTSNTYLSYLLSKRGGRTKYLGYIWSYSNHFLPLHS